MLLCVVEQPGATPPTRGASVTGAATAAQPTRPRPAPPRRPATWAPPSVASRRPAPVPAPAAPPPAPASPPSRPPNPPTVITHEWVITGATAETLYELYLANISPLAEVAALRHLDPKEDVLAQFANPRIEKIVAWQANQPVGLAMVTNSLDDVPEISPPFLRARYPEHAARDAIYVGMLVLVDTRVRGLTVFNRLYTELWQVPARAAGVLVFDICEFNRTMFDTDALTQRIASMFPRSSVATLDRQTWYVAELPEPIPEPPRPIS